MASLPTEMQKNYLLLRELDVRFHELKKDMENQCADALQEVIQATKSDSLSTDALVSEHSKRIESVQQECLSIAEKKLALAVQTYELVDSHIQQLDADYRKYEEELKRERESAGTVHVRETGGASKGGKRRGHLAFVEPNEPTYCYCKQVSYGDMIACDNPECKVEWFHFDCVGVKERPKGKWYCTECAYFKRRRGK